AAPAELFEGTAPTPPPGLSGRHTGQSRPPGRPCAHGASCSRLALSASRMPSPAWCTTVGATASRSARASSPTAHLHAAQLGPQRLDELTEGPRLPAAAGRPCGAEE